MSCISTSSAAPIRRALGRHEAARAIARTLAQNPRLLLLDEPFGALDAQVRWEMEEMIIEIIERENKTVIVVTPRHPGGDLSR